MTVFVDQSAAPYLEEERPTAVQRQHDYFGKSSVRQFGPEAFLVDYGPERVSVAHFHSVDQFQVFFGAPGARYRRHPIPAVELHYADAFVTYGPFSAGPRRFRFFTLRACQGQYKGKMPAERHKLRYRGRRGIHVDVSPLLDRAAPAPGEIVRDDLIAGHDDGLAAQLITAGPGTEIDLGSAIGTSGRYTCVLAGGIRRCDATAGPMALGWTAPDETESVVHSAPEVGSRLLTMTFPWPPTPEARASGSHRLTSRRSGRETRPSSE